MAIAVVLAVGLDPWLLATQRKVWKSAGFFVASADSIGDAIDLFNDGDFDLVVLGPSISPDGTERFTSLIRASGSQTPVAFIGKSSCNSPMFGDSAPKSDSGSFVEGLQQLLVEKANMPRRAFSAPFPNLRLL